MRATINSEKHFIQRSLTTVAAGAVLTETLVDGSDTPTSVGLVRTGALVKALYVELWVRTSDTAPGSFIFTIEKLPSNLVGAGAASMAALDGYSNKKNILYTTQGLSNDQDADALMIHKGWIAIPKGKQRIGLGDRLVWTIFAQALDQNICGVTIYKEYY